MLSVDRVLLLVTIAGMLVCAVGLLFCEQCVFPKP